MAKDPLTDFFDNLGKSGSGGDFSQVGIAARDYRVELVWLGATTAAFGGFFLVTHRNALTAGAFVYAIWMVLLAFRPSRQRIRQSLGTSSVRRRWDVALRHCGFKHPIPLRKVRKVAAGYKAQIYVGRGISFQDLERQCERLAASMKVRELRLSRDDHNAGTGTVVVVKDDPLAGVAGTVWPGHREGAQRGPRVRVRRPDDIPPPDHWTVRPRRPGPTPPSGGGNSIWDPIPVGIDEHGETVTITLPQRNLLIGGSPGAGKSAAMSMILASAALDRSVRVWLIDGKMVELAEWESCAESFAHSHGDAIFLLHSLRGFMDRRFRELRGLGKRSVQRDLSLPLDALFVDELSLFTTGGDQKMNKEFSSLLLDIVARGRAAGVMVVTATQKPEGTVVSTNLRDLFAYRWALACGTPEASDTILGRGWASRGFDAARIAPGEPGVGYLRAEDGIPVRLRGFYLDDDDIHSLAGAALRGRP